MLPTHEALAKFLADWTTTPISPNREEVQQKANVLASLMLATGHVALTDLSNPDLMKRALEMGTPGTFPNAHFKEPGRRIISIKNSETIDQLTDAINLLLHSAADMVVTWRNKYPHAQLNQQEQEVLQDFASLADENERKDVAKMVLEAANPPPKYGHAPVHLGTNLAKEETTGFTTLDKAGLKRGEFHAFIGGKK